MRLAALLITSALSLAAQGLKLGDPLPAFRLPGADGQTHASKDLKGPVLVVWLSTYCPAVKAAEPRLLNLAKGYQGRFTVVGVNSNAFDPEYPNEGLPGMRAHATAKGYGFRYLRDESQDLARTFGAACTPDFFLFDAQGRLAYRGRLDNLQTEGRGASLEREDLKLALEALLAGRAPDPVQKPARGCSIKWKDQG